MDTSALLNALFRWIHVASGVLWIGLLYFFNFVNGPFSGTLDGETKKKVVPELMPRALFWFRWGAAFTWITGLLLLFMVFYMGNLMYPQEVAEEWSWGDTALTMVLLVVGVFAYDILAKSGIGKNLKTFSWVGLVLTGALVHLMISVGGFDYRAYSIHAGVLFGSIMAFNVWFRIWPSQKKIIGAVKAGSPPDQALVSLAGSRSRTNTYLSVPLFWTMINMHTTTLAMGSALTDTLVFMAVILVGWGLVAMVYKQSAKVKGF